MILYEQFYLRGALVALLAGKSPLDKGDFVKKGTLLGRVRAADYAQKVDMADAQTHEAPNHAPESANGGEPSLPALSPS